ncbi:hypothetical protein CFOL_v3_07993 [Cephalotus follicularis]|uniref:Uncharacterized protein n=1 Tax=Cephalotus follicularis TaxID=3775 RepID=A0A1Q3B9A1_CEPFO|nr:hypothetical protein CFOL_v3_07993 [Cephalotus follicularis]
MEATKEATGILNKILPPRLEDAGLEDCALPPESIKEAFLKAATAVKSRATSLFATTGSDGEEEERSNCVNDPYPTVKDSADDVVGLPDVTEASDALVTGDSAEEVGPCGVEKNGGVVEEGGDKVVVVGGDDVEEREGERKGCVDGLKGLKIKDKLKNEEESEGEEKKPILTQGFV